MLVLQFYYSEKALIGGMFLVYLLKIRTSSDSKLCSGIVKLLTTVFRDSSEQISGMIS